MCRKYDVVRDSSSQSALDRAAEWLSYCVKHDESCKPPDNNFVPRRLLKVIPGNQTGDPFLFDATQPLTYACLSYCWGEDAHDVLKTTTSNLKAHYDAIPLRYMPKSIQDAITVCRGLGIPYLWVDSLCIVQDDHVSWLRDASMMDRIYLYSHVTIAALEPSNCKFGFLGEQKFGCPGWQLQSVIPGTSQEVIIRPGLSRTAESSLDKRGWCLQETLLPLRRLCFDGNEMSWECSCRKICECGHHVWPTNYGYEYVQGFGKLGALLREASLRAAPAAETNIDWPSAEGRDLERTGSHARRPHKTYELWRKVVSEYSRRSLSRSSDKLTALAGLANMIGGRSGHEGDWEHGYLAGLWKKELPFELAWRVVKLKSRPAVPGDEAADVVTDKCGFPSWSWASCDEEISYDFGKPLKAWKHTAEAEYQCIVRDTEGILGKQMWQGDVGRIRLEGAFVPAELAVFAKHSPRRTESFEHLATPRTPVFSESSPPKYPSRATAYVRSESLRAVRVFLDKHMGPTMRKRDARAACWMKGECEEHCCSWDAGKEEEAGRYYCFRLFSWVGYTGRFTYAEDGTRSQDIMGPEAWFLLLRPSLRIKGAFERIGVGVASGWSYSDDRRCPLFHTAETKVIDII